MVYGNQQQQQANATNVLQTRYQNEQTNEKTSNSLTSVNGQQQAMTNNSALAAAIELSTEFQCLRQTTLQVFFFERLEGKQPSWL